MIRTSTRVTTSGLRAWLVACALGLSLSGCFDRASRNDDPEGFWSEPEPIAVPEYRVVRGDTLYGIAFKHGLDWRDLATWNGIEPPYTIYPGELLQLGDEPRRASPAASTPAAAQAVVADEPDRIPPDDAPAGRDRPDDRDPDRTAVADARDPGAGDAPGVTTYGLASEPAPATAVALAAPPSTSAPQSPRTASSPAPQATSPPAPVDARASAPASGGTLASAVRAPVRRPGTPDAAPAPAPPAAPKPSPTNTASAPDRNTEAAQPATATQAPVSDGAAPAPVTGPSRNIGGVNWRWPARGSVVGRFLPGDPSRQGINVQGKPGEAIGAAADGEVVYSGNGLVGYGELVIVKHGNELLSAYGGSGRRLVREGARVKAGQPLAQLAGNGVVHFEIRRAGRPVDPMEFLPQR